MATFGDRLRALIGARVATVSKTLVDFHIANFKEQVQEMKATGKLEALVINGMPYFPLGKSQDAAMIGAMEALNGCKEDGLTYESYLERRDGVEHHSLRVTW